MIGETEPVGDDTHGQSDSTRARTDPSFDPSGNAMRQAAWGGIGAAPAVFQWWYEFSAEAVPSDGWRFYGAVQRFLGDVPVSDGRYRNVDAAVSTPGLIVIGQKDVAAGRAYLYVYNRQANWDNLARHVRIIPVTGTLQISGLPPRFTRYMVARYDCATGGRLSVAMASATGGVLTLHIKTLAQDTAFKISPLIHVPDRKTP